MEAAEQEPGRGRKWAYLPTTIRNPQSIAAGLSVLWFAACLPFTPDLASVENLSNLFSNLLPLLIVATGQTLVLVTGGIDLSVTSVMALTSVTGAFLMQSGGIRSAIGGTLVMLLIGAAIGALNGLAITRLAMPPFLVTLTTMMFFSGLAIWVTRSKTISGLPAAFTAMGKNLWLSFLITALLGSLAHLLLSRSLWGCWLYALGNNVQTARISGVPVPETLTLAYILSGFCGAWSAILYTGRLETGSPVLGQRLLLDVIGAAVIGGTSLLGGRGKIVWTLSGVIFLTLIDNTLNLNNASHFTIMMVKGGVILLAALLDISRLR